MFFSQFWQPTSTDDATGIQFHQRGIEFLTFETDQYLFLAM
jgi:hypothetical protein